MAFSNKKLGFVKTIDCKADTTRKTRDVATRVSGRKNLQSTELDMVNGSFCNLCALALGLALGIFATQC